MIDEEDEYMPDKDAINRLGAMYGCHDCGEVINIDRDRHLFSRPNIFRTRYRCKKCGKHFQRFLKAEFGESWRN